MSCQLVRSDSVVGAVHSIYILRGGAGMPTSTSSARGWKAAAPFILTLCGILFVISHKTAGGTDLRGSDLLEMPDLVRSEERRVQQLAAQAQQLEDEIDSLTDSRGDHETQEIQEEIEEVLPAAQMEPVQGPAITVTLDDSPQAGSQDLPPNTNDEDYIVHQQDLEAVMNAMWAGGAEAMMVMDQRIGSTSTVRCVGSVLLLEGRKYAPPYEISAIGDVEAMERALEESRAVAWFRSAADALGLGYEVEVKESVTMPGYEGPRGSGSRS
ncbi:hypothetical protein DPM12_10455 [Phytoactinopolyspora halophila]|uniref:DUF881 domain-containing protein n=2 Tax=Phytoactinopolyspora halophila TaxID=1981511 RepID=A0A329QR50_9ACTN|nr:hypothetical protein DPM12_10455 [Phytoactinopolyspora halophila]